MSYTIFKQPASLSNSSAVNDFVIYSPNSGLSFILKKGDDNILTEYYSPDAFGYITIRDIGDVCRNYLIGDILFTNDAQRNISAKFTAILSDGTNSGSILNVIDSYENGLPIRHFNTESQINGSYTVEFIVNRCDAISANIFPTVLKTGEMNRTTYKHSREYLSAKLTDDLLVKKILNVNGNIAYTGQYVLYSKPSDSEVYTIDCSPEYIEWLLSNINYENTVGYLIYTSKFEYSFWLDNADYSSFKCFLFKNCFGVNETISVTGPSKRKSAVNSTTGYINGLARRVFTKRDDAIEVLFGVPDSLEQYLRLIDFFASTETYIRVGSGWEEIIITEIKNENDERLSQLTPISFTFKYSNHKQNFRI